ncbi:MAG: arsenate reductase ArsC, partial [Promethearchaeota archaeon]
KKRDDFGLNKTKLIVLCNGNSARSQMAEAFLRRYASKRFDIYSAGFEPKGVNPYTIKVMEEIGYDLSSHYSKSLNQYLDKIHFKIVITVCQKAEEMCPIIPGVEIKLFWSFEDPASFEGTEKEKLIKFRKIRDKMHEHVKSWLKTTEIVN